MDFIEPGIAVSTSETKLGLPVRHQLKTPADTCLAGVSVHNMTLMPVTLMPPSRQAYFAKIQAW